MRPRSARWPARPRGFRTHEPPPAGALRLRSLPSAADALLVRLAERPGRALAGLLALNLALAAAFAAAGALAGDPALLMRELMPGTLLSFAQLLLIAAAARAILRRDEPGLRPWHSFWGLCAAAFLVFAFDEITQASIFASHLLEAGFGLEAASGFHDLQAVLMTLLFAAVALVLLPRAVVLLRHPRALGLLGVAVLLGAACQGLDSFAPATRWEFVAEETLKLGSEVFFLGGFLAALADVLRRDRAAAPAPPRAV